MLIAQISDIHACAEGVLYKGVAHANQMLEAAIEHLHQLDRRPDLVLVTGDLTDEGRATEYEVVARLLGRLEIPCLVIPGNHDERNRLRAAFATHRYLPGTGALHYCVDDYPVRIVALDSCQPGKHYGEIDEAGLKWLDDTLQANTTKPTLLLMHHPPFFSGIPYMDEYRYIEADRLKAIVEKVPNIAAVLVGHVHRNMVHRWAGTLVMSCPSTTTEIALQLQPDARPLSYIGPPACLLHLWSPSAGLVTHTSYIGQYEGPYEFF